MASSSTCVASSPASLKRRRDEDVVMLDTPTSSPLTDIEASQPSETPTTSQVPPAVMLVSLPGLLIHPPNHPLHAHSLCISLLAIRKCLQVPNLSPDVECRAWTSLAELGMAVVGSGLSNDDDHIWAKGIENEIEDATTKGLSIAQKHPTLRWYRSQLTFLAAQLATWQNNIKFAQTLLRRHLTTLGPSDPPAVVYTAHLKLISALATTTFHIPSPSTICPPSPTPPRPQDIRAALTAIQALQNLSTKNDHGQVTLLAQILRLRLLISSGQWEQVEEALIKVEKALSIDYSIERQPLQADSPRKGLRVADLNVAHLSSSPTKSSKPDGDSSPAVASQVAPPYKTFSDPFTTSMALHTLIIGVILYTHVGRAVDSTNRLSHLHALLDGGALKFSSSGDGPASGLVDVSFPGQNVPLQIQTTHPRVLYVLAYLVSAVAKKDPVGRKPKKKIFSMEGLVAWEKEVKKELMCKLPNWATVSDVDQVDLKLAKIKADLLCELIGVSIMRSDFDSADKTLALLIAHLRTHSLFDSFSARVTLHHAHLAHSRGDIPRALQCYKVAIHIAEQRVDDFVKLSASAGFVALRIGLFRQKAGDLEQDTKMLVDPPEDPEAIDPILEGKDDWEEIERMGMRVAETCKGMGGTMWSVGRIIEACLSDEILKAKQDLRTALNFTSSAGDNHLRALILALIASQFFHTSADDALNMLAMCENLAAGLGAVPGGKSGSKSPNGEKKSVDGIGNAPLRIWAGERSLELYRRSGNSRAAKKQEAANEALRKLTTVSSSTPLTS
ncbi:hypothetical protein VNI00_004443 [Paramarasmius palmivorus]|uniref:Uncharacterized protein n=1 Tax=Paramarasmius palmivorus TaxID=297713 RepID=A0AAW0DI23_9AGAR